VNEQPKKKLGTQEKKKFFFLAQRTKGLVVHLAIEELLDS